MQCLSLVVKATTSFSKKNGGLMMESDGIVKDVRSAESFIHPSSDKGVSLMILNLSEKILA